MREYAYLNEWYEELGIDPIDESRDLGWSIGSNMDAYWQAWLDFSHRHITTEDGRDCISISFWQEPIPDFADYF